MTRRSGTSSLATLLRERVELLRGGLILGENVETKRSVSLAVEALFTHLHLIGPPGCGKTNLLLHLFGLLLELDASIVLLNPKGAFGRIARDIAVARGHARRLVLFDPGEGEVVMGYNPLLPSAVDIELQVQAVLGAILAGWGQSNIDQTPQMGRCLTWALHTAREQEWTLLEAVDLLRPGSTLRRAVLSRAGDPYIRNALAAFDALRESRQDELGASSVARLERFVTSRTVRAIVGRDTSLSLGEVIAERQVLIVNLERPLGADAVRLLGRMLINGLVSHVFARGETERRKPVFLIADEMQTWLTDDIAQALDQGRELGLCSILAHQHFGQLEAEGLEHLIGSVKNCCRAKAVFGGVTAEELLRHHIDELFFDRLDPRLVKDEITSLVLEPVEEVREVVGVSVGGGHDEGRSRSSSRTTDERESQDTTKASGVTTGRSRNRCQARAYTDGEGTGASDTELASWADIASTGLLYPSGGVASASPASSMGETTVAGGARASAHAAQHFSAETVSESEGEGWHEAMSLAVAMRSGKSRGVAETVGTSEQETSRRQWSVTAQRVPFTSYRKTREVTSRTFYPLEEQRVTLAQAVKKLPTGYCVFRPPHGSAVFLRVPLVRNPEVEEAARLEVRKVILARPYYAKRADIDEADRVRRSRLLQAPAGAGNERRPRAPRRKSTVAPA